MAEGNDNSGWDAFGNFLDFEIANLPDLYIANADSLMEAFSKPVKELLRKLSEERFFQNLSSDTPDPTCYFADISAASIDDAPIQFAENTSDHWETTRSVFQFLYRELMPAPKEERKGVFKKFVDGIKEKASQIKLPDGAASLSSDGAAKYQQCVTAVNTMKDAITSRFESLKKFARSDQASATPDASSSCFHDARHTGGASNTDPSRGAHRNAPERNETIFRRNPAEASRVITENPMHAAGRSESSRAAQQMRPSVVMTNPAHSSLRVALEVDPEDRPISSPPCKRPPFRRQSHISESSCGKSIHCESSIMGDILLNAPDLFIKGCKELVLKKVEECKELAVILCMHPESPQPPEKFRPVLNAKNIKDAVDRLNKFFDEEGDDSPLLPKKSSLHLRPDGRSRRSQSPSPSPTRKRIKTFLENEYENLCKMGSKFKNAFRAKAASSPSRKETASSSKSPTRNSRVILDILVEITKIEVKLGLLDALITVNEEEIKCIEVPPKMRRPPTTIINSMKNSIYIEYHQRVAKKLNENKEVLEFVRQKSGKTFGVDGSPSGAAANQPLVPSPSRKQGRDSSKASPVHLSKAGPSTASQGNVTGEAAFCTPKRTRTKSLSPRQASQEKKEKASPDTEEKGFNNPECTSTRRQQKFKDLNEELEKKIKALENIHGQVGTFEKMSNLHANLLEFSDSHTSHNKYARRRRQINNRVVNFLSKDYYKASKEKRLQLCKNFVKGISIPDKNDELKKKIEKLEASIIAIKLIIGFLKKNRTLI